MRTVTVLLAAALLLPACGDDDPQAGPTTSGAAGTTTAPEPGGRLEPCTSDAGFTISAPASWSTGGGCTWFGPEPFDLPAEGTDERVAPVSARLQQVAFADVAAPDEASDAERAITAIDGFQAVRLVHRAGDDSLYPPGTPLTTYAVDLSPGVDDGPGTLLLTAVGLDRFDHERNRRVLDRMARSIDVTVVDAPGPAGVVARYEGGGGAFGVVATRGDDEVCLRGTPSGAEACVPVPGAASAATVTIDELGPVLAGVTGPDVAAVTAEGPDAATTFLPVPVTGADARGFAFPLAPGEVDRLVLRDAAGDELATVPVGGGAPPGGGDGGGDGDVDDGVGPVGEPATAAVTSEFPGTGEPALLTDVRVGHHEGFDRVVLELTGDDAPGYRVAWAEPPLRRDGSGHPVEVAGEAFLELRLAPSGTVDLSGDEPRPTYSGPSRIDPGGEGVVTEVVRTGDFEGHLAWVVGLERRVPFAVEVLRSPLRLVVDLVPGG